jgi:biopolymer transport protein TolQ
LIDTEMTIWSLIAGAGGVVQAVMALLMLASVISWVLIFQRAIYLFRAGKLARSFEDEFWSGIDLRQLYTDGSARMDGKWVPMGMEVIFRAGFKEFNRLSKKENQTREGTMDGAQRSMRIAIAREQDQLEKHLPFLASVASVSPYIGLFGTVWGIMNSFRGLATVHQATLATVAPGISEALVATAMGLFAAIPAVLAYNRFSAKADSLSSIYNTFAEEFSSVLYRSVR